MMRAWKACHKRLAAPYPVLHLLKLMAHQGWDSSNNVDMQHGLVDYSNALPMMQTISTTDVTPLARVNWNEPGQIMKILDAGCYGIICPMVSNRTRGRKILFKHACTLLMAIEALVLLEV